METENYREWALVLSGSFLLNPDYTADPPSATPFSPILFVFIFKILLQFLFDFKSGYFKNREVMGAKLASIIQTFPFLSTLISNPMVRTPG